MRRRTRRGARCEEAVRAEGNGREAEDFFARQGKRGGFFSARFSAWAGKAGAETFRAPRRGTSCFGNARRSGARENAEKGEALCPAQPLPFFFLFICVICDRRSCAAERQRGASRRRGRNAGAPCAERVNFAAAARGVCAVLPEFHTEAAGKSGKSVRRTAVFFTKGKTAERPAGRGGRGFRRERSGLRSLQCFYKVDGKNTFSRV